MEEKSTDISDVCCGNGRINFDLEIDRHNTFSEKWDHQGGDFIPLWVADMDFRSPEPVIKAVTDRINEGVFGYTEYEFELSDVIVGYYKKYYDIDIEPEWIVWIPSVMPGVNIACRVAGGKILYNTPMYPHIRKLTYEAHCPCQEIPLKSFGGRYVIDFERMEKEIDSDVKAYVLCNPHNPVGRVFTYDELKEVSEFCKRHELLLISDEIHSQLIFEGTHIPAFVIDDYARENSVTLTSAGKTYNLPGIPVAFAIIPNPEVKRRFRHIAKGLFSCANTLSSAALRAAYTECDGWREQLIEYLRGNRDYLEQRIDDIPGLSITHNEATYLSWIDARGLSLDDPWTFFREKAGVNFSDGKDFGNPGFIRANFGCTRAMLKLALDRVENAAVTVM